MSQFEDLQACYLKLRKQGLTSGSAVANGKMGNGHMSGEAASLACHLVIAYLTSWGLLPGTMTDVKAAASERGSQKRCH